MSTPPEDRRRFTRIPFKCDAIISNGSEEWPTQLLDISLNGALIEQPQQWQAEIGETYQLIIKLSGSDISIVMNVAQIMYLRDNHVGFKCEKIGIDSVTHLRQLIEFNLGDPDLIHRELDSLVK